MGLLSSIKKGVIGGLAAIAMASASGALMPMDYNPSRYEQWKEYRYEHQDIDGLYDYDTEMIENIDTILQQYQAATREIDAFVIYETKGGIKEGQHIAIWGGSCLMLDGGYILSAGHVVRTELEELVQGKGGGIVTAFEAAYYMPINGIYYEIVPVWTSNEDFTILKFKEQPDISLSTVPLIAGDTANLANESITYTFSALNEPFTKKGYVYNSDFGSSWEEHSDYNYFLEDTDIDHGDSGGPVIAFLDGKPQLIGVTCYKIWFLDVNDKPIKMGGILKIDRIMEEASFILNPPTISNP